MQACQQQKLKKSKKAKKSDLSPPPKPKKVSIIDPNKYTGPPYFCNSLPNSTLQTTIAKVKEQYQKREAPL
jgi:hypothetical protein